MKKTSIMRLLSIAMMATYGVAAILFTLHPLEPVWVFGIFFVIAWPITIIIAVNLNVKADWIMYGD